MKNEFSPLLIRITLVGIILFGLQPGIQDIRVTTALNHARYYMKVGQPENAEIQLKWIESMESWQILPWFDLASIYFDQEKPAQSIAILEPLRNEILTDPGAWLTLASGYEKVGKTGQMEATLIELIQHNETGSVTETAYKMIIKYYRSQNRLKDALERQSDLARIAPKNKEYKFEKVLLSLAVHPEDGLQEWRSVANKPVWLEQVGTRIADANLEKSESLRFLEIGRAFGGINHWDLAEYWMQQAVVVSPNYAEAWAFLAEARQQRGLDGKEQINRALELASDSPGVRALAALYFRRQNDYTRAIKLLQQNIVAQPAEPHWFLELGSALAQAGKMEDAVAAYQRAIELSPLDYQKLTALAWFSVNYEYRIKDLGLPAAEKAIEMAANEPETQDIYGVALRAVGQSEKAEAAFSLALSLNPVYAPTWLHIGQAAISDGDSTLAQEALLKTVKISGNSNEAQIARRLLEQYYLTRFDSSVN